MNKTNNIDFNLSNITNNKLSEYWLKNSIVALAIAGIYSIIIVFLRIPSFSKLSSNPSIFRCALIIHVNLSVLVWLLSMSSFVWSLYLKNAKSQFLPHIFVKIAFCAMLIMAASPLIGKAEPILNNYIPILDNVYFITGLVLFGVSILFFAIYALWHLYKNSLYNISTVIVSTSAVMYMAVWFCFVISYIKLKQIIEIVPVDLDFYYELLFWSGGHLLQFLYTQGMIWLWSFLALGLKQSERDNNLSYLLILNFVLSLVALLGHYFNIIDAEFKDFYTLQMRYLGGIAPILCLLDIFYKYWFLKDKNIEFSAAFICSSLLFVSGGIIGVLISGMNLTIPAHYHGSIVGITIAFMGLAYACINISKNKISSIVIYTITLGQVLHIGGLSLAGSYGALRKAPEIALPLKAKLAMGIMGGGGLIAILGGLMFVIICLKKLYFSKNDKGLNVYNT